MPWMFSSISGYFSHHGCEVAAIVQNHIGIPGLAILQDGLLNAPLAFLFNLSLPGIHCDAFRGDAGSGMILSGEMLREDQRTSAPS